MQMMYPRHISRYSLKVGQSGRSDTRKIRSRGQECLRHTRKQSHSVCSDPGLVAVQWNLPSALPRWHHPPQRLKPAAYQCFAAPFDFAQGRL